MVLNHCYLYGPAVDQILAQENPTLALNDPNRLWWFLPDNQGSTRDLVDNAGALVTGGRGHSLGTRFPPNPSGQARRAGCPILPASGRLY